MGVATGKKKSDLNQPTTFTTLHPWPGSLHKPPLSALHSFQYFLGASIFFNTTSLIPKARHKLIPGILRRGDIKTHLEVSVEASLHAYFRQLSPGVARWSQPGGAGGHRSAADCRIFQPGMRQPPRGCLCGRLGGGHWAGLCCRN